MKVSVIMTIYNGEKYLEGMIKSLLFQIRRPDEIICVDDGSTDGSVRCLAKLSQDNPILKVYPTQNQGSAAARLYGLSKATGEAVVFVDCDDFVDPDYISSLHDALVEHEAQIAVGGFAREREDGSLIACEMMEQRPDIAPTDGAMVWVNTALWNKMFLRSVIPEDLSFPRIRQGDDLAFFCRILPQVEKVTFVPKPMYHYIVRDGSLMANFQLESYQLLKQELALIAEQQQGQPIFGVIFAIYFISLCVSQLCRYYRIDKAGAKAETKALRDFFDQRAPGWRKIRAFQFGGGFATRPKGLALWLCGKLFQWGLFPAFEALMAAFGFRAHW